MTVAASCLGFPRIGTNRELKRAVESYWSSKSTAADLHAAASGLRRQHWSLMKSAGIDYIPSNDFSLYDHMLDTAVMVGAVPARFHGVADPLARYFAMARGLQDRKAGIDVPAMEMTKWFDTNYHYIVPELESEQQFHLDASKVLAEVREARALGIRPRPVVVGPVTFLMLSKMTGATPASGGAAISTLDLLDRLLPVYEQLLGDLAGDGVEWVQIDEPCLVLDLDTNATDAYRQALGTLAALSRRPRIMLATYFGPLRENSQLAAGSGVEGLHIDLVRAPEQLDSVLALLPSSMLLSAGVVDGRNIWRTDLTAAHSHVRQAVRALGEDRVIVAPSCSLLHVPFDVEPETGLDDELRSWLAFAVQKLGEVKALSVHATDERPTGDMFKGSSQALSRKATSPRVRNANVRKRVAAVDDSMTRRASPFRQRAATQQKRFKLPPLPTTTIGSFPQTTEVRRARAAWRAGKLSEPEYERFVRDEIRRCVEKQSAWGLDVLVHGEFERNDMVQYFGEQLSGYAFTKHGWVQSYGSRCVRPPIIYGDVSRPHPMTVEWSAYAQSLTEHPMKGMLTGPVTMLQWSFVRDDLPRGEVCRQIALAIRDEVVDLEKAGIRIIQIDEPAFREGLPLRRQDWPAYLDWAVHCFRLISSGVRDETQIQCHMCYSEFNDIIDAIGALDADVISIETARSKMELLEAFSTYRYPNEIGPGVYDIHAPRCPSVDEMVALLDKAKQRLAHDQIWVNPDCGLKTRKWEEVRPALANMVEAAKRLRVEA